MIRLIESVLEEVQRRRCPPLESWLFNIRMQFWPLFQKLISEQATSLNKMSEATTGGYFKRASNFNDGVVQSVGVLSLNPCVSNSRVDVSMQIADRYTALFSSFVILTPQHEETMIFAKYAISGFKVDVQQTHLLTSDEFSLQKLRHELTQLILNQSKKIADPLKSATYQSSMFEMLLQAMTVRFLLTHRILTSTESLPSTVTTIIERLPFPCSS